MLVLSQEFAGKYCQVCYLLFPGKGSNGLNLVFAGSDISEVAIHAPVIDLVLRSPLFGVCEFDFADDPSVEGLVIVVVVKIVVFSRLEKHPEHVVCARGLRELVACELVLDTLPTQVVENTQENADVISHIRILITFLSCARSADKLITILLQFLPVVIQWLKGLRDPDDIAGSAEVRVVSDYGSQSMNHSSRFDLNRCRSGVHHGWRKMLFVLGSAGIFG